MRRERKSHCQIKTCTVFFLGDTWMWLVVSRACFEVWISAFIFWVCKSPPTAVLSQYAHVCECRLMQRKERLAHTHTKALAAHPVRFGNPNPWARFAIGEGCFFFLVKILTFSEMMKSCLWEEKNSLLSTKTISSIFSSCSSSWVLVIPLSLKWVLFSIIKLWQKRSPQSHTQLACWLLETSQQLLRGCWTSLCTETS